LRAIGKKKKKKEAKLFLIRIDYSSWNLKTLTEFNMAI